MCVPAQLVNSIALQTQLGVRAVTSLVQVLEKYKGQDEELKRIAANAQVGGLLGTCGYETPTGRQQLDGGHAGVGTPTWHGRIMHVERPP